LNLNDLFPILSEIFEIKNLYLTNPVFKLITNDSINLLRVKITDQIQLDITIGEKRLHKTLYYSQLLFKNPI
jgi:hypothetical protein